MSGVECGVGVVSNLGDTEYTEGSSLDRRPYDQIVPADKAELIVGEHPVDSSYVTDEVVPNNEKTTEIELVAPVKRDLQMILRTRNKLEGRVYEREFRELLDMQLITLVQEHVLKMPYSQLHGRYEAGQDPHLILYGYELKDACINAVESGNATSLEHAELRGMQKIYEQFVNGSATNCFFLSPVRVGCEYGIGFHLQKGVNGKVVESVYLYDDKNGDMNRSQQLMSSVTQENCYWANPEQFIESPVFSHQDMSQSIQAALGLSPEDIVRCERMSSLLLQQSEQIRSQYADAILRLASLEGIPKYEAQRNDLRQDAEQMRDAMMGLGHLIEEHFEAYEQMQQVQRAMDGLQNTEMMDQYGNRVLEPALEPGMTHEQIMYLAQEGREAGLRFGSSCAFGGGGVSDAFGIGMSAGLTPMGALSYVLGNGQETKTRMRNKTTLSTAEKARVRSQVDKMLQQGGKMELMCCPYCCYDEKTNTALGKVPVVSLKRGSSIMMLCKACGAQGEKKC